MTYVLHGARGSGSCAVECVLAEIGADYERRELSLRDDEQQGARYAALNPHCKVPSLVIDDGTPLSESVAILLTLDDRHPETALFPAKGTPARAQALRWLLFAATEIYPIVEINDYPERFGTDPDRIDAMRERAREIWRARWLVVEANVTGEVADTETLASLGEWGFGASIGWNELLEDPRGVLLAEAGAGKTREMSEQAKRLVEGGRQAFFVPLESLDREPLPALLSSLDGKRLESWLADGIEPGWFFLDAVDELKLTDGKLDRALRRFSRDIDGHLDRARIVVSCRPSDWRSSLDLATVRSWLPVPERRGEMVVPVPEEVFIAALQHAPPGPVRFSHGKPGDAARDGVQTVAMLPVTDGQIREATRTGIRLVNPFLRTVVGPIARDSGPRQGRGALPG